MMTGVQVWVLTGPHQEVDWVVLRPFCVGLIVLLQHQNSAQLQMVC